MATGTRSKGRRSALVNGATATTLLVVLAAVSLFAAPPSPPSIAEFAPQAQQQIEEAPEEQSAAAGAAGAAGAQETTAIEETAASVDGAGSTQKIITTEGLPSALNCVTWPDGSVTQTFDPQSPPCIASWDVGAGNGGATWRGVTETEIRVSVQDISWKVELYEAYAEHVNTSYQLYGRRIVPVPYEGAGYGDTPESQMAWAEAALETGAFADLLSLYDRSDLQRTRRLSDAGMVVVTTEPSDAFSDEVNAMTPNRWMFNPAIDTVERNTAEFLCATLPMDGPATHAGPVLQGTTRKLALLMAESSKTAMEPLLEVLGACGVEPRVDRYDDGGTAAMAQSASQILADYRLDGITTILSFDGEYNLPTAFMPAADSLGYQPEWILVGDDVFQHESMLGLAPPSQTSHVLGLDAGNRIMRRSQSMGFQAFQQARGEAPPPGVAFIEEPYRQIMLIATAVQMAGPDLTPQTLADGLQRTTFPNPSASRAPFWSAAVGFGPADHSMIDDIAAWWFNPNQTRRESSNVGRICYVRSGERWGLGQWPQDPLPFFDPADPCT